MLNFSRTTFMRNRYSIAAGVGLATALAVLPAALGAQQPANSAPAKPAPMPPASGSDPQFKVRLRFNRWHDVGELKSDFEKLAKAWPKFLKLSSLGKSHGGRDIILMTIN